MMCSKPNKNIVNPDPNPVSAVPDPVSADVVNPKSAAPDPVSAAPDPVYDDLPSTTTIMYYVDTAIQTSAEVFFYHCWYFWAPPLYSYVAAVLPFVCWLPADFRGLIAGGLAQWTWMNVLTFRQPKEIESVFMMGLRGQDVQRKKVRVISILLSLYVFAKSWEWALQMTEHMPLCNAILNLPRLPDLRCPITGEPLDPGFNGMTIGAIMTEHLLSTFHYWGLGLVYIGSRRQLRGLGFFRTFTTPLVIYLGKQLPTGRPSINSSVALITALRFPMRWQAVGCLALADFMAAINTIACPKSYNRVQRRLTRLAVGSAAYEKMSPSVVTESDDNFE